MFMQNGDSLVAGPLDVVCIRKHSKTDRFHAFFYEEKPLPGPTKSSEETNPVRLKSKMHHTQGFDTFDEAKAEIDEMREKKKLKIDDENVWTESALDWNGDVEQVAVKNWRS